MFYAKLAFTNIRKNGKFYYPYLLTCIFTIAMYYIMLFIAYNPGLEKMRGAVMLKEVMGFGSYVVAMISFIFLVYANSFLMKRRKKEFGLYNILGLEKRHIGKIMFFENVYVVIGTLAAGIVSGIIFSRLILMVMSRLLRFDVRIGFNISTRGIIRSIVLFVVIFAIILIGNLNSVRKTNPIELLHTAAAGEREPKTKFLLTLIGIGTLLAGYGIALKVESALTALSLFFIAVILVVIGTYCLFISGSITFLKLLKRNKKYYYKINHFTSVSGMIYRMKKNAAGLASICILSTMVLVVISTTVSLYVGGEDSLKTTYPYDLTVSKEYNYNQESLNTRQAENEQVLNKFLGDISKNEMEISELRVYEDYYTMTRKKEDGYEYLGTDFSTVSSLSDCVVFEMIYAQDYEKMTGIKCDLAENEVLVYGKGFNKGEMIRLGNMEFRIADTVKEFPVRDEQSEGLVTVCYMVLPDKGVMDNIYLEVIEKCGDTKDAIHYNINVNLKGTDEEKLEFYDNNIKDKAEYENLSVDCRQEARDSFYMMNGSLLCLGAFLGLLFIIITILIIYYKQITEGYEDRQRFEIMQKVGMSEAEVRQSIKSQILTVFILPIIVAACHVLGAFNMIKKILLVLNLYNVKLFIICTICTFLVFVLIYMAVYLLTAKIYYRIVKS